MNRNVKLLIAMVISLFIASCASMTEPSVLAATFKDDGAEAISQLVWVGTGTTYIFEDGRWLRTPEQDYEFLVRQNRFENHWESLKVQNRIHPEYDGTAGPADQQHFFKISYGKPNESGQLPIILESTYGNGTGESDLQFHEAILEFEAEGVSSFAPYNRFRITQEYRYEEGLLLETVELFKLTKDGVELPFVKINESARIFSNVQ
jgi:hypothetical protein